MSFDIFRLDWILIDSVISIILIIILIGVNIVKKQYRWRLRLSNEALEKITIKSTILKSDFLNQGIRKWTITYPKIGYALNSYATIIIIRNQHKFMLLNALTEGLSTYGFKVINIWIGKPKKSSLSKHKTSIFFSDIIKYHVDANLNLNNKYCILTSSQNPLENAYNLLDNNNFGVILLNTNINRENFVKLSKLVHVYGIFSQKLILYLRNPYLTKFIKLKVKSNIGNLEIKVIRGAKRSFRYYETILLAELINYIKKNSNK